MCGQVWNLHCGISVTLKGFRLWSAFQSLGLGTLEHLSRGRTPSGLHCDLEELLEVTQNIDVTWSLGGHGEDYSEQAFLHVWVQKTISSHGNSDRHMQNCVHSVPQCPWCLSFVVIPPLHFWLWHSCHPLNEVSHHLNEVSIFFIAFLFPTSLISALIFVFFILLCFHLPFF